MIFGPHTWGSCHRIWSLNQNQSNSKWYFPLNIKNGKQAISQLHTRHISLPVSTGHFFNFSHLVMKLFWVPSCLLILLCFIWMLIVSHSSETSGPSGLWSGLHLQCLYSPASSELLLLLLWLHLSDAPMTTSYGQRLRLCGDSVCRHSLIIDF